jgi:hypothetical protein
MRDFYRNQPSQTPMNRGEVSKKVINLYQLTPLQLEEIEKFGNYALLVVYVWWFGDRLERFLSPSPRAIRGASLLFILCGRFTRGIRTDRGKGALLLIYLLLLVFSFFPLLSYGLVSIDKGGSEGVKYLMENPILAIYYPFLLVPILQIPTFTAMVLAATPSVKENLQRLHGEGILKDLGYNSLHRTAEDINKIIKPYLMLVPVLMLASMCHATYIYWWTEVLIEAKLEAQAAEQTIALSKEMGINLETVENVKQATARLDAILHEKMKIVGERLQNHPGGESVNP